MDTADRVVASIEDAAKMLAELPGIGQALPDVSDPRYRFWRVFSYLLAYRVCGAEILIVRVLYGRRDIRELLGQ